MLERTFSEQMKRMRERFGEKNYPDDFLKILWQKVSDFSDTWMISTVSNFSFYSRLPPMGPEWEDRFSAERERLHRERKTEYSTSAKEGRTTLGFEDIANVSGQIQKRVKGAMTDSDFSQLHKLLDTKEPVACGRCQDTHVYFDQKVGGFFKCTCKQST